MRLWRKWARIAAECWGATLFAASTAMAQGSFALPASGIKESYSPLAIPTYFKPIDVSLETLLNQRYAVVAAHVGGGEEVLVLAQKTLPSVPDRVAICALTMPNPAADQTIVTSRCWALNHFDKGQ